MELNSSSIISYIEEYGIDECVNAFSEVIEKRSYYSVKNYEIKKKEMPLVLPAVAFVEEKEVLALAFLNSIDLKERQIKGSIPRNSNLTVEKLAEKYEKLLVKNSFQYILTYGKELLLRDRDRFLEITRRVVLLDDISSGKGLLLAAFEKINSDKDTYIYHLLSYLTKMPNNFTNFEKVSKVKNSDLSNEDMVKAIAKKIESLEDKKRGRDFLYILGYLSILNKVNLEESIKSTTLNLVLNSLNSLEEVSKIDEVVKSLIEVSERI